MAKQITTQDVAKKAGVSVTTVSRVINNTDHPVNSKTAQRVLEAIDQLGFTPSALARALVTRHSGIIGALVGDSADPYFAQIAYGIHTASRKYNSIAILCNTLRDPQLELEFISTLDQYRADGILIAGGPLVDPVHCNKLQQAVMRYHAHGGHVITLSEHFLDVPSVRIDNVQASFDMASYLVSLGHRRIGYVRGPKNLKTTYLREEGFIKSLQHADLPCPDNYRVDGDFSFESGIRAIGELLTLPEPPTAVFAANDVSALGCVVGAQQRGLHIPTDLSVCGMDGIEATLYVNPSLTTISIPMEEIGSLGVKILQDAIRGDSVPQVATLPHSITVNGSTARFENN